MIIVHLSVIKSIALIQGCKLQLQTQTDKISALFNNIITELKIEEIVITFNFSGQILSGLVSECTAQILITNLNLTGKILNNIEFEYQNTNSGDDYIVIICLRI
ncbi:Hypothetical_protein [Hexamita inflata]|uniref:Hypothetical_protein n=1 Tax=Hexamita inflata TaxID=28002 RepID=A0AA86TEC4_9EUKA|nr:Hypothetical protein HINF_LOCUS1532 [Hexamita inflata]